MCTRLSWMRACAFSVASGKDSEKQDSWCLDSSYQFCNASTHCFQKSWQQTQAITNYKYYSPNNKHDNIWHIMTNPFLFQYSMVHDGSWWYKCLLSWQRICTFIKPLISNSAPPQNDLPGAGRAFWAAETGRIRLLRQSSSGRRRELPTTQIVTIKPQMKSMKSMICIKMYQTFFETLHVTCLLKSLAVWGLVLLVCVFGISISCNRKTGHLYININIYTDHDQSSQCLLASSSKRMEASGFT